MAPLPTNTTSITLPNGWSQHGDEKLVCKPTQWTDVVTFLLVNYLAHCATVKSFPAETAREIGTAMILALFLPSSGIMRALDSIFRRSNLWKGNALEKAARAGALCMVVRNANWEPKEGDVIHAYLKQTKEEAATDTSTSEKPAVYTWELVRPSSMFESVRTTQHERSIRDRDCKVHGTVMLPEGYSLAYVPSTANVSPTRDTETRTRLRKTTEISCSYSFLQSAIAIVQTVYASVTLYRTRGDQVDKFGYASFGLTVTPYILMSLLNLMGQVASSNYPTLYMVHSEVMDEAIKRKGVFDGVVGTLVPASGGETREFTVDTKSEPIVRKDRFRYHNWDDTAEYILRRKDGEETVERQVTRVGKSPRGMILIPMCAPFTRKNTKNPWDNSDNWRITRNLFNKNERWFNESNFLNFVAPVFFGCISIAIFGGISHFRKGEESTSLQRGFVMSWLIVGFLFGPIAGSISKWVADYGDEIMIYRDVFDIFIKTLKFIFLYAVTLVPAVGGLIVVCQELLQYGSCTRIG